MKKDILEYWVGLFVLLGIAALGLLSFKVASNGGSLGQGRQTYTLFAEFDNVGGLKPQAPVRVAGVLVGRVTDINLTESFQAKVSLDIDKKYRFSSDASAQILTSGLLGEQYVGLTQGGDEEKLDNGDTIALTSSAVVLENLINQVVGNFINKDSTAGSEADKVPGKTE